MSRVYRLHCDGCHREADVPVPGPRWAPDGWFIIEGEYGGGEPWDEFHACSYDCLIAWANRQRRNAETELAVFS